MVRKVSFGLWVWLFALSGAASGATVPELTPAQRAERLKALPEEDRKWLEEYAAPIILPEEARLYLQLTEPYQREIFREDFWARRERAGLGVMIFPDDVFKYVSSMVRHMPELAEGISANKGETP